MYLAWIFRIFYIYLCIMYRMSFCSCLLARHSWNVYCRYQNYICSYNFILNLFFNWQFFYFTGFYWNSRNKHNDPSMGFPCMKCGKIYKNRRHLTRHLNFECGIPPMFQCPACPARTKRQSNLKQHILRRHPELNASLY